MITIKMTTEKQYSMDEIMPACMMEKLHEKAAEQKKREEEERARLRAHLEELRKTEIKKIILNSGIIKKINQELREKGSISISLGDFDRDSIENNYWDFDKRIAPRVNGVENSELFEFIHNAYKDAGYKTYSYKYSARYYKDYNLTIFAKTNCETCQS